MKLVANGKNTHIQCFLRQLSSECEFRNVDAACTLTKFLYCLELFDGISAI